MPASSSSSMNFAAMVGESLDGFRITVLPQTIEASVMPAMIAHGKIPRRNYRAHAQRNVEQGDRARRAVAHRLGLRQTQRFAGIELAEVDGFGDVAVGFGPVLADFKNQPRHEFELAFAQQVGHAEQQAGALFKRSLAPGFEGLQRRLHRGLDVFLAGLLMKAHHLRRLRRIDGLDLVRGLDALAADDQVVLAAQLAASTFSIAARILRAFSSRVKSTSGSLRMGLHEGELESGGASMVAMSAPRGDFEMRTEPKSYA